MTAIREQLDAIILGLKRLSVTDGVRFVREYAAEMMEAPITGFIAAVGVTNTERSQGFLGSDATASLKGEMFAADVEIRVYAPYHTNGSGLSEMVSGMLTGLREADEAGIITAASASAIEFDAENNAVFRRLSFRMEFCLCEEETT